MIPIRRLIHHPALVLGVAAVIILVAQGWKAAREDYGPDEGFTVRRIEAAWHQVYFPFAQRVEGYAEPFDTRHVYDMNPPLYFVTIRALFGPHPHRIIVRLFSILPILIALLCLGALAQEWGRGAPARPRRTDDNSGDISGGSTDPSSMEAPAHSTSPELWTFVFVWLLSPIILFYGHEARPYAAPIGLFSLSLFLLWRWRSQPLLAGTALFLSAALGFLTNFHYPWLLGALAAAMLLQWPMRDAWMPPRAIAASIAGMILGIGAACLALLPQWDIWFFVRRNPTLALDLNAAARAVAYPLIGPLGDLGRFHLPLAFALVTAVLAMAVATLFRARRPALGVTSLCLWLIPMLAPILGRLIVGTAFFERYTLFCLPGFALTLAWLVGEAVRRGGWRSDVALLVLAAYVGNGVALLDARFFTPMRPRWTPAITALIEQSQPEDGYFIQPEWQISAFAANAPRPPAARYLRPGEEIPPDLTTLWFICDDHLPDFIHSHFLDHGWRIEPVVPYQGKYLWKLLRAE